MVVMQRVHVGGLTGFVLDGPEESTVLKLPAIGPCSGVNSDRP